MKRFRKSIFLSWRELQHLSTGIGPETQKPLAIVVIGGLVTATVITLLTFPLIFAFCYRELHPDGPAPQRVGEERPVLVGAERLNCVAGTSAGQTSY